MDRVFDSRATELDGLLARGLTTDYWYSWCEAVEDGYINARGLSDDDAKKLGEEEKFFSKQQIPMKTHVTYRTKMTTNGPSS